MIIYLRDLKGNTLVDIEIYKAREEQHDYVELKSVVCVKPYSDFLLKLDDDKQGKFIDVIDDLSELRGWMWENYFMVKKNDNHYNYDDIVQLVALKVKEVADYFGLYLVTD